MDARMMQPMPPGAMSNDLENQRLNRRIMELESQVLANKLLLPFYYSSPNVSCLLTCRL
jgi:hypothetical protein